MPRTVFIPNGTYPPPEHGIQGEELFFAIKSHVKVGRVSNGYTMNTRHTRHYRVQLDTDCIGIVRIIIDITVTFPLGISRMISPMC